MLVLDPSSNNVELTANILRNSGHAVRTTQIKSIEDLEIALEKQQWDLFIVRDNLNDPSAKQCLDIVQHYGHEIPFIMTTTEYSIERTIEAMRLGMKYVLPEDNEEYFLLIIERELANIADKQTRKFAEKNLRETSRRNELLLGSSRDAIAYITDGMHIYANLAYMELFGYEDPEDLECMPVMDLMEAKGHEQFKKYLKEHSKGVELEDFSFIGINQDGTTFEAYLSLTDSVYDGENCTQIYIKTADASDEELELKLKELTAQDRLTGLFNQHYFLECIDKAIENIVEQSPQSVVVMYLQLDNYDEMRDKYGITESDQYLREVSLWLKERQSLEDTLARIGDNTFAILTVTDELKKAELLGNKLCEKFAQHLFEIDNNTVTDTLSIGICPILENTPGSEKVLSNAHFVSSRVNAKGGNHCLLFDSELDILKNRDEASTAMEIQEAMDDNSIYPLFEPVVKLHGKAEKIFNVKLAFKSKEGNPVTIEEAFVINHLTPTAIKLDNWLMAKAFSTFSKELTSQSRCKLKVHLSAASMLSNNLITNIKELLQQNELYENNIIFEFCEHDVATHLKHAIKVYNELGENNMISALSDFGNSLDSTSVLEAISCKSLKWVSINASLFNDFTSNTKTQETVSNLLTVIHEKGLTSIAPGIADAESMATIYPMGVHHIYGDYIGDASKKLSFDFSEIGF